MATDQHKSEVYIGFQAPNAPNLQKAIDDILAGIEKLPQAAQAGSKSVKDLADKLREAGEAVKRGGLNEAAGSIRAIAGQLKALNLLKKGLEVFSNKDIQNINQAANAIRAAARAADFETRGRQVRKGIFGLETTTIRDASRALKVLQEDLKGFERHLTAEGRVEPRFHRQWLAIKKNIDVLNEHKTALQNNIETEKRLQDQLRFEAAQTQRFYKVEEDRKKAEARRQDGRVLAAERRQIFATSTVGQQAFTNQAQFNIGGIERFANPIFVQTKETARRLADERKALDIQLERQNLTRKDGEASSNVARIQARIRELVNEQNIERAKGLGITDKELELERKIAELRGRKKLVESREKRSDKFLREAEEENRKQGMMSRVTGSGGAALLAAQAALIANYSIINAVTGSISGGVRASIELEQAFRNVQAVTAITSTEMAGLEEKIKQVAGGSRFTAKEVADAALVLGQAGLSAREVSDALGSVVQLATAAGTSLAQAVDLVTSVVGVFDKKASDTADVANKITQASNSSKVSVDKLALALQYAGNAAAQTGVSFEETLAVLASMANAGIKSGSTMGTGLRQFLTEIQKPSEELIESLSRIGLSISDLDIRSNGLIGVIQKLQKAGFVAGDSIRSFDVRGAAAFNALLANPEDLSRQYDMLLKTEAATKASEIQMNSFDSQAKRLTTTINNLVSSGIAPFQQALTGVMSTISSLLAPLAEVPGLLTILIGGATAFIGLKLAAHFAGIAPALLGMLGVSQGVLTFFGALRTATLAQVAAGTAFAASNAAVLPTIVGVGAAAGTTTGLLAGLKAAVMGLTVFGAVGVAVAAASAALYIFNRNSEDSKKKIEALQAAADEAKAAFTEKEDVVKSLTTKIGDLEYAGVNLKDGSEALKRTVRELNSQFGNLGFQMDDLQPKYADMMTSLRNLRNEMRTTMGAQLSSKLLNEQKLEKALTEDFEKSVKQNTGDITDRTGGTIGNLQRTVRSANLSKLTDSERASVESIMKGVSDPKKITPESMSELSRLFVILQKAVAGVPHLETRTKVLQERLQPEISRAMTLSSTRTKLANTERESENFYASESLRRAPIFRKGDRMVTLEEAAPRQRDLIAEARGEVQTKSGTKNVPELDVLRAGKVKVEAVYADYETMIKTIQDNQKKLGLSNEVTDTQISALRTQQNEVVSNYSKNAKTLEAAATTELKNREATIKLSAHKRTPKQTADLLLKAREEFDSLFTIGPNANRELARKQYSERLMAQAEKTSAKTGTIQGANQDQERIEALNMRARSFQTMAKTSRMSAKTEETWKGIDEKLAEGIDFLAKSHAKELEALTEEQTIKRKTTPKTKETEEIFAAQRKELEIANQEEMEQYRLSYADFYTKTAKTSLRLREMVDLEKDKLDYDALQEAAAVKTFEAGAELNQIATEIARGVRPQGSTLEKEANLRFTMKQMEILQEQLDYLGDSVSGYIGARITEIEANQREIERLTRERDSETNDIKRRAMTGELTGRLDYGTKLQAELASARRNRQSGLQSMQGLRVNAEAQGAEIPLEFNQENLTRKMSDVAASFKIAVDGFDQIGDAARGVEGILNGATGTFSSFFMNMASGAMSVKEAFKSMAASVVKSIADIIARMLAMYVVQQLTGFFMGPSTSAGAGVSPTAAPTSAINLTGPQTIRGATGGIVTGGVPNKDSVAAVLMPGEGVLNKKAMETVGTDFVHSLNQNSQAYMSRSARPEKSDEKGGGGLVNVWVVTPDQKPGSMGPSDVVAVVSDNMMNRGSLRQLVKQISIGAM